MLLVACFCILSKQIYHLYSLDTMISYFQSQSQSNWNKTSHLKRKHLIKFKLNLMVIWPRNYQIQKRQIFFLIEGLKIYKKSKHGFTLVENNLP